MTDGTFALSVLFAACCVMALAVLAITARMTPVLVAALEGR